ncbi:MAG: hypothetical protein JO116_24745, partial [Planctomycetaceae bacterium]|nr:hypothetical protein [Planctomycetaceae bacterium]
LDDGRVELLAEGEAAEVAVFLDAVRREMDPYILDIQEERESPGDRLPRGFSILP